MDSLCRSLTLVSERAGGPLKAKEAGTRARRTAKPAAVWVNNHSIWSEGIAPSGGMRKGGI